MSEKNGKYLKEGDFIHSYGILMVRCATPTTPYAVTSMFASEAWRDGESFKYKDANMIEIEKLRPHLTNGKKFHCIENYKDKA